MKTIRHLLLASIFILACATGHAATHMVQNGQSLQTALTNAASGDVIMLHDGFYDEDCVVTNKGITVKSINSNANLVQVRSITVNNAPDPSSFSHLRLSSSLSVTGSTATVQGCNILGNLNKTNGDLNALDTNVDGNLTVTQGSVTLVNCTVDFSVSLTQGGLTMRNCTIGQNVTVADAANGDLKAYHTNVGGNLSVNLGGLTLMKCTVNGNATASSALGAGNRELVAIVLQSTIGERFVCKAKRSWTCYNLIRHAYFEGEAEITGNEFDGRTSGFGGIGIDVNGTSANIRNNHVHHYFGNWNSSDITDQCIGIRITGGARAEIVNNLIHDCYDSHNGGSETNSAMGIFVQSTNGTKILGNVIWKCYVTNNPQLPTGNCPVWAPFEHVVLKNNYLLKGTVHANSQAKGGVQGVDNVHNDDTNSWNSLKFVTPANGDFTLQADSPLKNAGPPDAQYNDLDGTRNDIGMFGGHNFIPNGKTTDKPIPIQLSTTPAFVPIGGTVTIESTGATVK